MGRYCLQLSSSAVPSIRARYPNVADPAPHSAIAPIHRTRFQQWPAVRQMNQSRANFWALVRRNRRTPEPGFAVRQTLPKSCFIITCPKVSAAFDQMRFGISAEQLHGITQRGGDIQERSGFFGFVPE